MDNFDKFYKNVRSISNSLVIKFSDSAFQMEKSARGGVLPVYTDIDSWKYYKHLRGLRYALDGNVYIKVIETETEEALTKELLDKYLLTKNELLKGEDYYTTLINSYPEMSTYIHGCMFPVTASDEETYEYMETLRTVDPDLFSEYKEAAALRKINLADNGTILAYDKTLLEENEDNLISELEKFCKGFIKRHYNSDYAVIDNLYISSFLGILYSLIPIKIINIRIRNISTYRAHSFFLEAYFRSRFDLWDNVSALKNKKTLWWLYGNLDYLIKNIGKNKTMDTILEKIFNADNIGVGLNYIKYKDPSLNSTPYDSTHIPFNIEEPEIFIEKLNSSYNIKDNTVKSLSEILNDEMALTGTYTGERKDYVKENYIKEISKRNYGTNVTKVFETNTIENFTGWNVDIYAVLLDYWTYLLSEGSYGSFTDDEVTTTKVDFLDPNTKRKYNIDSRQGYYIFIKILLAVCGKVNMPISNVNISYVLDPEVDLTNLINKTLYIDGYVQKYLDYIKANYPIPNKNYNSYNEVAMLLNNVIKFYKNLWILTSNCENSSAIGNLRSFLYNSQKHASVKIHKHKLDKTINELLAEVNIDFEIGENYDYLASIKELVNVCLGITADSNSKLEAMLDNIKDLFKKLTSYTVQITGNISTNEYIYLYYNHNRVFMTENGIIKLYPDKFRLDPTGTYENRCIFIPKSQDKPFGFVEYDKPIVNPERIFGLQGLYAMKNGANENDYIHYSLPLPSRRMNKNPNEQILLELLGVYQIPDPEFNSTFAEVRNVTNATEGIESADDHGMSGVFQEEIIDGGNNLPDFIPFIKPQK